MSSVKNWDFLFWYCNFGNWDEVWAILMFWESWMWSRLSNVVLSFIVVVGNLRFDWAVVSKLLVDSLRFGCSLGLFLNTIQFLWIIQVFSSLDRIFSYFRDQLLSHFPSYWSSGISQGRIENQYPFFRSIEESISESLQKLPILLWSSSISFIRSIFVKLLAQESRLSDGESLLPVAANKIFLSIEIESE